MNNLSQVVSYTKSFASFGSVTLKMMLIVMLMCITTDNSSATTWRTYTGGDAGDPINWQDQNNAGVYAGLLDFTNPLDVWIIENDMNTNADLAIAGSITIEPGGVLRLSGANQLTVGNNFINNGGLFVHHNHLVELTGIGNVSGFTGFSSFYNLTISGSTTLASNIEISNDITINSLASLDASASNYDLDLTSNWINNGTFVPRGGTVVFSTGNPTITGNTTFFNLTIIASTLSATPSTNVTVDGQMAFTNGSFEIGAGNTLTLGGTVSNMFTGRNIIGSTSSNLTLTNTGALGDIYFDNSAPGLTNNIETFTMSGAGGSVVIADNLEISTALATVATNVFTLPANSVLSGAGTFSGNLGTIETAVPTATSATPIPTGKTWGGTVIYNAASAQTAVTGTYNNLTVGDGATSVTYSAGGDLTVDGTLTITHSGANLNMAASQMLGTLATIANNGQIETQHITAAFPSGKNFGAAGNVWYNTATPSQNVIAGNYHNLAVGRSTLTTTYSATGNLSVAATLATVDANTTLDMGNANLLQGTLATITNNGTITTAVPTATSATPLPTGKTWGGIVTYNGTSAQTIVTGTYNNLIVGGGGGVTHSLGGAATATGNVTINASTTLDVTASNYALNIGGNFTNSGTFTPRNGTVTFNGAAQNVPTTTFYNLTYAGSGVKTGFPTVNNILSMEGTATAGSAITYGAAATLTYNTSTSRSSSNFEWPGTFTATGGVIIANTGTITNNAGKTMGNNAPLVVNVGATFSTGGNSIAFGGDFTNNGSLSGAINDVTINGTGTQNISGFTANSVTFNKGGGTATLTGNVTVSGTLTTTSGTLDLGTGRSHTFGNWQRNGGTLNGGTGTNVSFSGGMGGTGTTFVANTGTVTWTGATPEIASTAITYNNLTLTTNGNKTASNPITVDGTLTIQAAGGSLNMQGNALIAGTSFAVSNGATIRTANTSATPIPTGYTWGGTVVFDGAGAQTIEANTFNTLTLNNATGATLTGAVTATTLNLTSGKLTLGANDIAVTNALGGTPNATNYVVTSGAGMLKRAFSANSAYTYHIGDATNYTPVSLNANGSGFSSTTIGARTNNTKPASNPDATNFLSRGWYVTRGGSATTLTTTLVPTYVDGDAANPDDANMRGASMGGVTPWIKYSQINTTANTFTVTTLDLAATPTFTVTGVSALPADGINWYSQGATDVTVASNWNSLADGSGTAASASDFTDPTYIWNVHSAATQSTTWTVAGSILIEATNSLNSGGNNISVGGSWTNNGTFTSGSGTVTFTSTTGGKTISAAAPSIVNFNNIIFNGASGAWSFSNSAVVAGNFTITNGTVTAPSTLLRVAGNWSNANTTSFVHNSGTVTFNGTTQSITGASTTFNNLTSSASSALALGVNTPIDGDLNITTGSFNLGTFTANRTSAGGTLTNSSFMVLQGNTGGQTGSNFPTNFTTMTSPGTVHYRSASGVNQTIFTGITYGAIQLSTSSGTTVKTQGSGTLNVTGTLSNSDASTTFAANGSNAINVGGNWLNSGTYTSATETVTLNGASQSITGTNSFYNLTYAGTDTKTGTPTVTNIMSIEGSATTPASGAITYGASATLQYNRSASVTTTNNEWPSPFTATGGVIIGSTGTITLNAAKTLNEGVSLTINSGATMNPASLGFLFGGNFTNNGTLSGNFGTVQFIGALAQSIAGFTCGPLNVNKGGGTATMTGNLTVGSTLTSTAGTLDLGTGNTHSGNGWTRTGGTLNGNTSTITFTGSMGGTGTTLNAGTSTFIWTGVAPNIATSALTYYNLTVSGTGTKTAGAAITVNGDLTLAASGLLANGGFAIDVAGNILGTGTESGTGILSMTGASKTISGVTVSHLTINPGGGNTISQAAALTVTGNLVISSGTFDVTATNYALSVAGNWTNSGTFNPRSGTVTFNGSGAQNLTTATTFNNLTINNSGTGLFAQASTPITVNGAMTFTSGKFSIGANTLAVNGTVASMSAANSITGSTTSNLTLSNTAALGTLFFDQTSAATRTINNFTMNGASGTAIINNNWVLNGAFTTVATNTLTLLSTAVMSYSGSYATNGHLGHIQIASTNGIPTPYATVWGGTVEFNGVAAQTLIQATYNNVIINNSTGLGMSGGSTINGALTFTAGKFAVGGNHLIFGPANTVTGMTTGAGGRNITGVTGTITANNTGALGTLIFDPTTPGTTNNITNFNVNGAGGSIIVGSDLNISTALNSVATATLNMGTNALSSAAGTFTGHNGTLLSANISATPLPASKSWGGTIQYNGAGAQTIASGNYTTLTLNNATGAAMTNTVTATTLNLTSGQLALGTNNLTVTNAVGGTLNASNHIVATGTGRVKRVFSANGSYTYPVGDGTNYTPITLAVTGSGYAAATMDVNTTDAQPMPMPGATSYLTRYWSITPNGITAPAATVTSAQFIAADKTGTPANIYSASYPAGAPWTKYSAINDGANTLATPSVTMADGVTTTISGVDHLPVALTWYSQGTGTPSDPANWNTMADGSGTAAIAADFTEPTYTWNLQTSMTQTASWTVAGNVNITATGSLTAGSNAINVGGSWANDGTFFSGSSTVTFTATTGGKTISAASGNTNFNNVIFSGAGGAWSMSNTATLAGNLTIANGTLTAPAMLRILGNFTNNASFTHNSGTVLMNGTTQTIGGTTTTTFNTLINAPSTSVTLANNISIIGNLYTNIGTFDLNTFTANRFSSGGTLFLASGATMQLRGITGGQTGSNFPANFTTQTLGSTSTVEYITNSIDPNIYAGVTYGNLTISSSGGNPNMSLTGTTTVAGDLTIGANTSLYGITHNMLVGGNWINNGNYQGGTGLVTFNGATQTIGGTAISAFAGIVINASTSVTLLRDATVGTDLSITSGTFNLATFTCNRVGIGGTFTMAAGTTMQLRAATGGPASPAISSNFPVTFNTYNLATTSTVEYISSGIDQTVFKDVTYGNLTLSTTGGTPTKFIDAGTTTVAGNFTIGTGTTVSANTSSSMNVAGNWINNATFVPSTGTVTFNGATQSVGGTSATPFNNLIVTVSGQANLTNSVTIAGNLSITAGEYNLGTFTSNRTASGGVLSISALASLRLGGTTGGATGSNYPDNFTTHSLASSSLVVYNAAGAQTVYATPTYGTLRINNVSGVSLNAATTATTLDFINGKVTLGSNNLSLTNAITGGPGASNYVVADGTGKVTAAFTANGSYTYHIGDATNYTPITLAVTGTGYTAANVAVNLTDAKPSANPNTTNFLTRFWSVTPTGITTPSVSVTTAQYIAGAGDVTGTESLLKAGAYTGSGPWVRFASVNTGAHTFATTATPLTNAATTIFSAIDQGPDVTNFTSTVASSVCAGSASSVAINSTTLVNGTTYTANYTLTGTNTGTFTSASFVYGSNTGTFLIDGDNVLNGGSTTVTVNYITDVALAANSDNVTSNNTSAFSLTPAPTITNIDYSGGYPGAAINITGTGFSAIAANNYVFIGGGRGIVNNASTTVLNVTLPTSMTYDNISVATNVCGLSAYSQYPFLPLYDPAPSSQLAGVINLDSKVDFTSGTGGNVTADVAAGDLDLDGKPDMVVSNYNNNTISIFLNTSVTTGTITATTFATQTVVSVTTTGTSINGIQLRDINGDGKLDVVIGYNMGSGFTVLRNTTVTPGTITFAANVEVAIGASANTDHSAIADLDNDGKPEIIMGSFLSSDNVHIMRNKSIGNTLSFATPQSISTTNTSGSGPYFVRAADVDGDGKQDLIVSNHLINNVAILRNTTTTRGAITFAAPVEIATGTNPYGLIVGDLDGNNLPEIIAPNLLSNNISVLRNTSTIGSVSFVTAGTYTTATMPNGATLADLDGDYKMDVIITNRTVPGAVTVFRNKSTLGSVLLEVSPFSMPTNSNPIGITAADFDGDKRADIAVANFGTNNVSVFHNDPLLAITGTTAVCAGLTTTLSESAKGGTWTSATTTVATVNSVTGIVTGVSAGTSVISYNVPGGVAVKTVTVNPLPVVSSFAATAPAFICQGSIITVTVTSSLVSNNYTFDYTLTGANTGTFTSATVAYAGGVGTFDVTAPQLPNSGNTTVTINKVTNTSTGCEVNAVSAHVVMVPVSPTPAVTTVSPMIGTPAATVNITGANFNPAFGSNTVFFGATKGVVNSGDANNLNVTIPIGATYMPISVLNNNACGLTGYSQYAFLPNYDNAAYIPGLISFDPKASLTTGTTPYAVAIGDLDGDGKADLALTNRSSNFFSVYRNNSTSGSLLVSSFNSRIDYVTSTNPTGIAIGDLNGDGKQDVVIANSNAAKVSVFKNTATMGAIDNTSFAAKIDYTVGGTPIGVAIGDLDKDGKPDIAVANQASNSVSLLRNTSTTATISFATKIDLTTAEGPSWVAIGDLDNDGKSDIVTANTNIAANNVSVFKNNSTSGTLAFSAKSDFAAGTKPQNVAIGDIDGDGKPDLAVTNFGSNNISIFRNTTVAGITFAAHQTFSAGNAPYSVAIADIDGDSKADVIISNQNSNNVSVFRNSATMGVIDATSFEARVNFTAGATPTSVVVGDLDGDKKPDLAIINSSETSVYVMRNGAITIPGVTSISPRKGNPGTTVTITGSNFDASAANNIVYFGATKATVNSGSTTSLNVTVPYGATYNSVSVNNNATGLNYNSQYPFLQTYDNSMYAPNTMNLDTRVDFNSGINPRGVVFGDFDGDGKADVAVANVDGGAAKIVYVYLNTSTTSTISTSSLAAPITLTTNNDPVNLRAADMDGDGKLDIVVGNLSSNNVSVFLNTGTTTGTLSFGTKTDVSVTGATGPHDVTVADFDGDGKADLAVANYSGGGNLNIIRNTSSLGSVSFGTPAPLAYPNNSSLRSLAIGDLDADGKVDIVANNLAGNSVVVYHNIATPGSLTASSFDPYFSLPVGGTAYGVAVADIDGDGKQDIVATVDNINQISIVRNNYSGGALNAGAFNAAVNFNAGTTPQLISIGDIDGDGKADIAVANTGSNTISVFRNTASSGSITGSSLAAKADYATNANPSAMAIGDLNNDGLPDVIATNTASNSISVFRNNPIKPLVGTLVTCQGATTSLSQPVASNGVWTTSNTTIATVNSSTGVVTGVAGGVVTVSYTVAGGSAVASYTVIPNPDVTTGWSAPTAAVACAAGTTSVTVNSAALTNGTSYVITYNTSAPNFSTGLTATMVMGAGTGTFVTGTLANAGTTTVTITNIRNAASTCNTTVSTNNTVAVTVNKLPTSVTPTATSPVCVGNTITLTGNSAGGTGNVYAWSGPIPANIVSTSSQNTSVTAAALGDAGNYTLTVTAPGCAGNQLGYSNAVTVNANPDVTTGWTTPTAATACAAGAATITIHSTALLPGTNYTITYDLSGANTSSNSTSTMIMGGSNLGSFLTIPLTNPGATAITVTDIRVTATSCNTPVAANNTAVITVNQLPTLVAPAATTPVCAGATITLTGNVTGGAGSIYAWTGPQTANIVNTTLVNTSINTAVAGDAGSYVLTVTAPGCSGSTQGTSNTVVVNPIPNVTAGWGAPSAATACAGNTSTVTVTSSGLINGTTYTVTYDLTGANIATSQTASMLMGAGTGTFSTTALAAAGTTTVIITAIQNASTTCSNFVTVNNSANINVNQLPSAVAPSATTPVCAGTAITLTGNVTGGTGLVYSWAGPVTAHIAGTGTLNTSVLSAAAGDAGVYTLTVTAPACAGNMAGNSNAVTVNAKPDVTTGWSAPTAGLACAGGGAAVTINSAGLVNGTSYTVTYNLTGANTATGSTASMTMGAGTGSFTTAALASIGSTSVTITSITNNSTSCTNTVTTTNVAAVTVNTLPSMVTASATSPVCAGTGITLTGGVTGGSGLSYSWAGPITANITNANMVNASVTAAMPGDAGSYSLTVTAAGCPGFAQGQSSTVTVNAAPDVTTGWSSPTAADVCKNTTAMVFPVSAGLVNGTTYTVTYNLGGANTATGSTASMSWSGGTGSFTTSALTNAGSTTVTITGIQNAVTLCSSTVSANNSIAFNVNSLPTAVAPTAVSPVCGGGTITLTGNVTGGTGLSYSWAGPVTANISNATLVNASVPAATIADAGTYTLTVSAAACPGTFDGISNSVTVNAVPDVTTGWSSPLAATTCAGIASTVTVNSAGLVNGTTYTVTYNLSGANSATGNTSSMTMGAGTGTFSTAALTNPGSTTVTITNIRNAATLCNTTVAANNTAVATVNKLPTSVTPSVGTPVCAGGTVLLTGNVTGGTGSTYSWAGPVTANISSTSSVNTGITAATIADAGAYTLTVTAPGCVGSTAGVSNALVVNATPNVVTGWTAPSASVACAGAASSVTINSSSLVNGTTYTVTYDLSGANTATNNTATMVMGAGSGTFTTATLATPGSTTVTIKNISNTSTLCNTTVSANNTASIAVNQLPSMVTAAATTPVCYGNAITLTGGVTGGTGITYAWTGPVTANIVNTALQNTSVASAISADAGTYVLTVSAPGCSGSVQGSSSAVTVNALPGAITGTLGMCLGSTTSLSNSVAGGTWTSSNGSAATVDVNTGVVYAAGLGTTSITYNTSCGSANALVSVSALPSVIAGASSVAVPYTIQLSNSVAGGVWSSEIERIATISAGGIMQSVSAGTAIISYSTGTGCAATKAIAVDVACVGLKITLSNGGIPGGTWVSGNGSIATVNAGTGVASLQNTGQVVMYYLLPGGTFYTTTLTVQPLSQITGTGSTCQGTPLTLTNTTLGGGIWSSDNTTVATISPGGLLTSSAAGTTTVAFTTAAGCVATKTVTIVAAANVSGPASVCAGQAITLTPSVPGGNWLTSTATLATITSGGVLTGASAGTARLSYMLPTGCMTTLTVAVNALSPTIGTTPICQGQSSTFTNATAGGGVWSSSNTSVATVTAGGVVYSAISGSTVIAFTTGAGCVSSKSVTVSPKATISGTTGVCVGQPTVLSASIAGGTWTSGAAGTASVVSGSGVVTGLSAGNAPIYYSLSAGCQSVTTVTVNALSATSGVSTMCQGQTATFTNATAGGGVWSSSNSSVATVTGSGLVSAAGAGTADITFTTSGGCVSTRTLTVNAAPVISGPSAVCGGQTITLSNSTGGGNWVSGNASIAAVNGAGVVTGVNAGTINISYVLSSGCPGTKAVTVSALAATTGLATVCEGQVTQFTNNTVGGGVWTSSNTSIATVSSTGLVRGTGGGSATISFTSVGGCVATKIVNVNGTNPISGGTQVCVGLTTAMSNATPGGNWSTNSGSRATISAAGILGGVNAGTVGVTYIPPTGCWTSTTVAVLARSQTTGGTPSICQSGAMTLANATSGGGVWTSSNTSIATVSSGGFVKGVAPGSISIIFTASNGCVATRAVTVNACREVDSTEATGITNTISLNAIQLFPNPTTGWFTLRGSLSGEATTGTQEEVSIEMIDLLGQVVYKRTAIVRNGTMDERIDLAATLANGTYIVNVRVNGENKLFHVVIGR